MDQFVQHFIPNAAKNYPRQFILPTEDLLTAFFHSIGGEVLPQSDINELLTQIVCVLLNADEQVERQIDAKLAQLPDLNRIVSTQVFASIKTAVPELAFAIKRRLAEFGAFQNDDFPYFFDRVLGRDIVLTHLPY